MKNINKIIAREFLLIILSIIILGIAYVSIKIYNYYHESKIIELEDKIDIEKNQLESINFYEKKYNQKWLYEKYQVHYSYNMFWDRLQQLAEKDSIQYLWNRMNQENNDFLFSIGFNHHTDFQEFILLNSFNIEDKRKYKNILKIKIDLKNEKLFHESKNINNYEIKKLLKSLSIILLLLFFIIRYLYYSIKWSIKTLKS
ncbi:MAG: hypothetical protein KDD41_06415 [Flavobacteriales bacterium]|nr:hypothetical protein [Flavobacteriales bacterium]